MNLTVGDWVEEGLAHDDPFMVLDALEEDADPLPLEFGGAGAVVLSSATIVVNRDVLLRWTTVVPSCTERVVGFVVDASRNVTLATDVAVTPDLHGGYVEVLDTKPLEAWQFSEEEEVLMFVTAIISTAAVAEGSAGLHELITQVTDDTEVSVTDLVELVLLLNENEYADVHVQTIDYDEAIELAHHLGGE